MCRYNTVQYDMVMKYITAVIATEYELEFEPTKYIP